MGPVHPPGMNTIQIEYGRKMEFTPEQAAEWLDDLVEHVDEMMGQPLQVGDAQAFCAPEVIRGAITCQILREKISAHEI